MPDETERSPAPEVGKLPEPGQDRTLAAAIDVFRRVLPADGAFDGNEAPADYADCFRAFEAEAGRLGVLYEGLQPAVEGGREHDVRFDETSGTVLKFTKPAKAAYVVSFEFGEPRLVPALPMEYLERQALHREIFGDDIRFVGMGGDRFYRRIITRQGLVKGRNARWDEIVRLMVEELGFTKLHHNFGIGYQDSYGFMRDDVAVFDMRPPNVFMTDSGLPMPVDSIPVRLGEATRAAFKV